MTYLQGGAITSLPNPLCVSINVSKATLDIAANSDIAQFTVSNDSDSFDVIIAGLRPSRWF